MVPAEVLAAEMPREILVMNFQNFVFLVFEPDLHPCVFDADQIEAANVVAFVFFEQFLVVHGESASEVDADQLVVAVQQTQVADRHRPVFGLLPCVFVAHQPPDCEPFLSAHYFGKR